MQKTGQGTKNLNSAIVILLRLVNGKIQPTRNLRLEFSVLRPVSSKQMTHS